MLGMAYVLVRDGLHDEPFLNRYTEGFAKFLPYLMGDSDGVAKTPEWASRLSGVSADKIEDLAHSAARDPSFLGISWSLQRQRHGEQSWWMITTLGAMLGYIGLPGQVSAMDMAASTIWVLVDGASPPTKLRRLVPRLVSVRRPATGLFP